jgi:hypothetical protein
MKPTFSFSAAFVPSTLLPFPMTGCIVGRGAGIFTCPLPEPSGLLHGVCDVWLVDYTVVCIVLRERRVGPIGGREAREGQGAGMF